LLGLDKQEEHALVPGVEIGGDTLADVHRYDEAG